MHRPKDTSDNLGISPATLRLWSNHFSAVLSPAAQKATTETGTAAQRRYTDGDLVIFRRAKQLLGDGKTYEDTLTALQADPIAIESPDESEEPLIPVESPIFQSLAIATETHPIIHAFEEALKAKDGQIESLKAQIAMLESRHAPMPLPAPQAKFRWAFLNKLLTVDSQDVG